MRPFYEHGNVTIYHGRAEDVLPLLAAESVDLVLTDPPYGVSYATSRRSPKDLFGVPMANDDAVPVAWLRELKRLARFRTAIYWFASQESIEETRQAIRSIGFGLNTMLVWDKQNSSVGDLNDYAKRVEYIIFGTNGRVHLNGSRDPNLISVPRVNPTVMRHPTEKPVPLLSYLVLRSTDPGELVLDPFMGIGGTLVAAKDLGRKAIGIEVEERYCEIAARRLAQDVMPLGVG